MPNKGYEKKTKKAMRGVTRAGIGVDFGVFCLKMGYSVYEIAEAFGVTKPTVYSWFRGKFTPSSHMADKMRSLMQTAYGSGYEPPPEIHTINE